jgi:tRNA threonylcarbamoyladenosine biosynthesis protein TsaE
MSSNQIQITTNSANQTYNLGQKIGSLIHTATVIALSGDLGSGKTTLIQGIARGLEVPEKYYITSPTFTLINQYPGRLPLFHVDLYRIEDPDALDDIGIYDILQENGVIAIEWADKLDAIALSEYIAVDLKFVNTDSRKIKLIAYGLKENDLLKKLKSVKA